MNLTSSVVLAAILIVAGVWDMRTRRIPNALTFPGLALGLLFSVWRAGWAGAGDSLLGILVGGGCLFLPFALGGIGAGDVKLLAVVGAFGGTAFVFRAFLGTALAGGVAGAVLLWRAGRLGATLRVAFWDFAALVSPALPFVSLPQRTPAEHRQGIPGTIPYGVAIALGTALAWAWQLR